MDQDAVKILLMLAVVTAFLVSLIRELLRADVAALAAFSLVIVLGLANVNDAFKIFANTAPITVAGMFVLSYALQRTGVIDVIAKRIGETVPQGTRPVLIAVGGLSALCSAFMNNTPIVAIFMPILLGLARERNLPASHLLIPLSYSAIVGGCCTVIGTSTNIIVNGITQEYGFTPFAMFDLAWVGVPVALATLIYVAIFAPIILPDRTTLTATLSEEMRKSFLCHILVKNDSPLVGKKLVETPLAQGKDFRVIEVRRKGARVYLPLNEIVIEPFDRILVSASARKMVSLGETKGLTLEAGTAGSLGVENLSTIEGKIVEGVIAPHSRLIGKTLRQINFRQTYGMLILAVHRHGRNVTSNFQDVPLEFGDTLLMLGPTQTFEQLRDAGDFLLLEEHKVTRVRPQDPWIATAAIVAVVGLATVNIMPIVAATTIACVALILLKVLEPDEAYRAIDWQIIFLIYGSLGVGLAMEQTGTAKWLASSLVSTVEGFIPQPVLPIMALFIVFFMTSLLTEVISNNATAAIMAPIAINLAGQIGVNPQPLIIAVMIAASCSFCTPIGYQTNTMVYGAGGYRFGDFVKFGIPLNIIALLVSLIVIPLVWKF